jgi:YVTN family beta-propeller protein
MKLPSKPVLIILAVLALVLLAIFLILKSSALKGPESIAWDEAGKRFLISNTTGKNIVSMSLNGRYSAYLKSGLKAPRGIIIKGNNLYVADVNQIHIIEVDSARIIQSIPVEDAKMLNDIALDKLGRIYVTDTSSNCVFIINPSTKTADKILSPLFKAPNGIIYDMPRDQMLIVGFSKQASVLSLSTLDRTVSTFMDSIYSQLDGIAIDDLGRIYISSWEQDMIIEIPQEQNRFIAKFKDIKDAADMLYYLPNNELIVPLHTRNKIVRIPLN